jgi:hypothetical protein
MTQIFLRTVFTMRSSKPGKRRSFVMMRDCGEWPTVPSNEQYVNIFDGAEKNQNIRVQFVSYRLSGAVDVCLEDTAGDERILDLLEKNDWEVFSEVEAQPHSAWTKKIS